MRRRWQEIFSTDAGLTVLLVSLVAVLFVIYPFVPLDRPGRVVVSLALTLVLVAGSFSLGDRRRHLPERPGRGYSGGLCSDRSGARR